MKFSTIVILVISFIVAGLAFDAQAGYRLELKKATEKGQLYDGTTWDAKVIWHATFFGDSFRAAFAKKHAKIHHMGPVESARWLGEQGNLQEKSWEFIVSLYTKKDYKEFSMYPDSFWEIYLTTADGEIIHPESIEQVPDSPYERLMFPHIDRWAKIYRVAFSKESLGKNISLTLQSIMGKSTLKWKVK